MASEQPTVASHYGSEEGERYLEYQVGGAEWEAKIALPRFAAHVRPTDDVVDFGSGTGWLLNLLDAGSKLGIEPNPAARRYAAGLGIDAVASPSDVADSHADVVISNHALEHSRSPYDELRELHRVLRPGGRLVIGLPVDDWRRQRGPDRADPNHHLFTWTPLLFDNLLLEAGFEVQEATVFSYLQPPYNDRLLGRIPRPAFDAISRVFGAAMRYRQLFAVATRP